MSRSITYKKIIISSVFIVLTAMILFNITAIVQAKYSSKMTATATTQIALMANNISTEIGNIKAYPGQTTIIPIKVTNKDADNRVCEVSESFKINLNRNYSNNIPLQVSLCKDASCNNKILVDENGIYDDPDFKFKAGVENAKTYYLQIKWPREYNDVFYSFEIDYIVLDFYVQQID